MSERKSIQKITLIVIIVLITLGFSTIYAAEVESNRYKIARKDGINYILGIYQGTRVDNFKKNIITTEESEVYDKQDKIKGETEIIKTGDKIKIGQEEHIAIVCGDTNGDGKVGVTDLVNIKQHLIGKEKLENEQEIAADIDISQKVTSTDVLNLKRLIVRIIEERQIYESEYENEEYKYKINKLTDKASIVELANNKKSGTLKIPNKIDGAEVVEIQDFLGENNRITEVIIPTNIENISNVAFSGMKNLVQIEVSVLNKNYSSENGVLYSKDETQLLVYPRGKNDKECYIEETVKQIGEYAFYKNNKIEAIYIPETIQEIAKTSFEEMEGNVYIKEGSKLKNALEKVSITYRIDTVPVVKKFTYNVGTNQKITATIEASDAEGIIEWCVGRKEDLEKNWIKIESTKNLKITYDKIEQNGTYIVNVKDKAGNIGTKEIIITELDETKPKVTSMKIISPASGEYKHEQKIIIRVEFNEKIKGTAPTIKLRIGDKIGTGKITISTITGKTNYIDYTYIPNNKEDGEVEIYSYSEGNLTDLAGNKVILIKLANTGNKITITTQTKFNPYEYTEIGTIKQTYKNDSIQISVERINSINVAKIWIKDPSKQIKKAEAGWNKGNKTLQAILGEIPNAIIGCNGSFFYDDGSRWRPNSSTDVGRTNWQYTTEGHSVISNGVIRRNFNNTGYRATVMGIDNNGQLMCKKIRNLTADQMISSYNIVNTFAASTIFIENNQFTNEENTSGVLNNGSAGRTLIGQVNYNNYILMSGNTTFTNAINIAKKLDCQFLFGLDGGGSTGMLFQGKYIYESNRQIQDAIYFTSLN